LASVSWSRSLFRSIFSGQYQPLVR
jgi:hypothetical protein